MGGEQEVGPAPDGEALTFDVDCCTDPRAERGTTHPVTIGPDWSLETPHDLDAERVAQAFGGFCSCVELADRMVPALREAVRLLTRRELVPVDHRARRMWLVRTPPTGCACAARGFTTVQVAARHVRGPLHLGAKYGVSVTRLRRPLARVEAAHGTRVPGRDRGAARLVLEPHGLDDLWDAGVHPAAVREAAALAPRVDGPLPVWFYLGVAFRPVGDRLRELLAECTSAQAAAWLVWSDAARTSGTARLTAAWLRTDVPRCELETLVHQRVPVAAAETVAQIRAETTARVGRLETTLEQLRTDMEQRLTEAQQRFELEHQHGEASEARWLALLDQARSEQRAERQSFATERQDWTRQETLWREQREAQQRENGALNAALQAHVTAARERQDVLMAELAQIRAQLQESEAKYLENVRETEGLRGELRGAQEERKRLQQQLDARSTATKRATTTGTSARKRQPD